MMPVRYEIRSRNCIKIFIQVFYLDELTFIDGTQSGSTPSRHNGWHGGYQEYFWYRIF